MAKKLWVGLGIGCGSLIVIVVVAVVALGFWAKHKLGGLMAAGQKLKAQRVEMAHLAKEYPFTPGADGQVVLTQARLDEYLAVRSDALTAYQKLQSDMDALKAKEKSKHDGSMSEGMQAAQQLMGEVVDVEQRYIDGLKAHKMSPNEFHAISTTVFASEPDPKNAALISSEKAKLEALRNAGLDGMLESDNPASSFSKELRE